jgi:SNF2 family DNA or RNA helicase
MFFESIEETETSYLISGFPKEHFARKLKKHYKSTSLNKLFKAVGMKMLSNGTVEAHKFFIPELVYLLRKFDYPSKLADEIVNNTWLKNTSGEGLQNRIDMKKIKATMQVSLLAWQQEYIESYDIEKQKYQLNGRILTSDEALGNTITSLALMEALGKKKIVIISPEGSVWEDRIEKFYLQKKKVDVVVNDEIDADADITIVNYESTDKLNELVNEDVGVIVDGSHNFLSDDPSRVQQLTSLSCKDMLLLSETSIEATVLGCMPMLMVLDPFFDDEAVDLYMTSLGVNTNISTDVLRTRLSVMMHSKPKKDLLKLPSKVEQTVKVKIPTGDNYTLDSVKNAVSVFVDQRFTFHEARMGQYIEDFFEAMNWIRSTNTLVDDEDFTKYLTLVNTFRKNQADLRNPETVADVNWVNGYEKEVIIPMLPDELKSKFSESKSAVKHIHLHIRGEVIGQLLMSLNRQMTSDLIEHSNLDKIIESPFKKSVIFTSYVETVKSTESYLNELGYNSLLVNGNTSEDVKSILDKFVSDPNANPLVTSIKSLSTGVTLTAANTVVFLNKPSNRMEFLQASNRVHGIGQDSNVSIISIHLDTDDKDNLSTHMEDMMEWTKQMFAKPVGE